jgi:uncharacterized protein YjbI with pentapeptide repeats
MAPSLRSARVYPLRYTDVTLSIHMGSRWKTGAPPAHAAVAARRWQREDNNASIEFYSIARLLEEIMLERSVGRAVSIAFLLSLAGGASAFDPAALADIKSGRQCAGCDLRGADLRGAKLHNAVLTGADLSGANLHGAAGEAANLQRSNLRGAVLTQAQLARADLAGANLKGADLAGANLDGADLKGAVLEGANGRAARLQGANLAGAKLNGADLSDTVGLSQAQLDATCGDSANTRLPGNLTLRPCR